MNKFDRAWGEKYKQRISDEFRDSINSVISLRNHIAHGDNSDATYITIKNYFQNIKKALLEIQKIILDRTR